jgi:hypothetical protein
MFGFPFVGSGEARFDLTSMSVVAGLGIVNRLPRIVQNSVFRRHGQSLAIAMPGVMQHQRGWKRKKLLQYAERVWGLKGAEEACIDQAISKTEEFFRSLGVGTRLADYRIPRKVKLLGRRANVSIEGAWSMAREGPFGRSAPNSAVRSYTFVPSRNSDLVVLQALTSLANRTGLAEDSHSPGTK